MYFLKDYTAEDFKMTNQSGTYELRDGTDDMEEFDKLFDGEITNWKIDASFQCSICFS